MRLAGLLALLLLAGCARNPEGEDENMRTRDTTMTTIDTVGSDDTVYRTRPALPDTAGGLDTTSRR
ncbi:MAG: hypothetical protein H0T58_08880 [Gemmatimonadales bacterium]|nr:hypothetical protein [Gemmatimonadales bacterium]